MSDINAYRAGLGPRQPSSDPGLRPNRALPPSLWPISQAGGQTHRPRAAQRRMHATKTFCIQKGGGGSVCLLAWNTLLYKTLLYICTALVGCDLPRSRCITQQRGKGLGSCRHGVTGAGRGRGGGRCRGVSCWCAHGQASQNLEVNRWMCVVFIGCGCLACLLGDRWKIKIVTFIHAVGKIKCDGERDRLQQRQLNNTNTSTITRYLVSNNGMLTAIWGDETRDRVKN